MRTAPLGFGPIGARIFNSGGDKMTDFQLLRKLRPGAEKAQALVPQQQPAPEPRLSETFARNVQLVESLEQELRNTVVRAQEWENKAIVAEERLKDITARCEKLQHQRDDAVHFKSQVEANFDAIAELLLKMIPPRKAPDVYRPKPKGMSPKNVSLEEELKPPPEFVRPEEGEASS
jgi:hypothetical protein